MILELSPTTRNRGPRHARGRGQDPVYESYHVRSTNSIGSLSLPLFFVNLWLVHYFSGDSAFGHNLKDGVYNKLQGVVSDPGPRIFRPRDFGLGVGVKCLRELVVQK
jgi:hypothetical protein